nr:rhomboid-like protein 12, mitochondrial [Tanacetum cinerariifolium]
MVGIHSFGKSLGPIVTPGSLPRLYIAGALGGAVAYLADCSYRSSEPAPSSEGSRPHPTKRIAVGASGAVTAMVCLDILLFPREKGIYMIWADVKRVKDDSLISGAAHLGGAAVGAIAFARLRWRL